MGKITLSQTLSSIHQNSHDVRAPSPNCPLSSNWVPMCMHGHINKSASDTTLYTVSFPNESRGQSHTADSLVSHGTTRQVSISTQ